MATLKCSSCGDEIADSPIRRGQNVYCSEACAYDASRSADCSGRSDISQVTHSADEIRQPEQVLAEPSQIAAALRPGLLAELAAVKVYAQHIRAIDRADIVEGLQGILEVEQGHARDLEARIRELGGATVAVHAPEIIEGRAFGAQSAASTLTQMLQFDLSEEEKAIQFYRTQIAAILWGTATVEMLKRHLDDETAHAQWLRGKLATAGGQ